MKRIGHKTDERITIKKKSLYFLKLYNDKKLVENIKKGLNLALFCITNVLNSFFHQKRTYASVMYANKILKLMP